MARNSVVDPRFALDANLLVYAVDGDAGARHELASQIVLASVRLDCWLTSQSVSEFYAAVVRKRIIPAALAAARAEDWLTAYPNVAASGNAVRLALADAVAGRASYWDALMIATVAEAGCTLILTED